MFSSSTSDYYDGWLFFFFSMIYYDFLRKCSWKWYKWQYSGKNQHAYPYRWGKYTCVPTWPTIHDDCIEILAKAIAAAADAAGFTSTEQVVGFTLGYSSAKSKADHSSDDLKLMWGKCFFVVTASYELFLSFPIFSINPRPNTHHGRYVFFFLFDLFYCYCYYF